MTNINRVLIFLGIFALVLAGSRWYFAPQQPAPSMIAQIRTATTAPVVDEQTWDVVQETIVPSGPIASVQSSDPVQLVPVEWAKTYTLWQWSTVTWIWKKIGGEHTWTLALRQWAIQVVDGKVVGWGIILDMQSITTTDEAGAWLDEVLQGDDFFGVTDHPTGSFIIQEVSGWQIVWVLTLKWISKQISFPGIVIVEDDSVVVTAQFALDRKQWWINWGWPVVSEFIELSFTVRFVP